MKYIYIWVNYNISPTWIKAIWGSCSLLTMIIVRSQWVRYHLPDICHLYPSFGDHHPSHPRWDVFPCYIPVTCLVGGFNPSQSCHLNQTIPLVWLNMVEKQSPAIKSGSKIPKSSWFSYDFPHHFHCFFDDFPIFWTTITGDFPFPPLAALADPKKKRQLRLPWRWSLPHGCRRGNRLERQNWSTGPKDRGNVRISLEKYGTNMEKCGHMINDLEKNENLIGKNAKWWWTMEQYGTIMDQLMEKWLTKQW